MNSQLIQKVIETNIGTCPDIKFSNSLLDRNVARALSKSFIEMLKTSREFLSVNSSVRHTILNNLRKLCKNQPEGHVKVGEEHTAVLSKYYLQNIKNSAQNKESIDKQLDDFLVRRMHDHNYNTNYPSCHNPEIIQALFNLNPSQIDTLFYDIINWEIDSKNLHILSNLWTSGSANEDICDDVAIKMKSEIEKNMLTQIYFILIDRDAAIKKIFTTDNKLKQLIMRSSKSRTCFQICSLIMNYLLISTNFDPRIQMFVPMFVTYVKQCCTKKSFSVLYPTHLSHIALLLDIDPNILRGHAKSKYVDMVIIHLHDLHEKSENELIMLLSHFPQWFEIFFVIKAVTTE